MYETSVALDPVAAFEFYLCKTQPDCKSLFQSPSKDTTKNINFANPREGYRNEPVWGKYHQQDDGTDFHQSRVASTVTSLFQRGVGFFFVAGPSAGPSSNLNPQSLL